MEYQVLAITDAGVLGCALQNTYTFIAKGPSAVRLQPAEKKPRKFLFTISNTLKRVSTHTQQYTTCACNDQWHYNLSMFWGIKLEKKPKGPLSKMYIEQILWGMGEKNEMTK